MGLMSWLTGEKKKPAVSTRKRDQFFAINGGFHAAKFDRLTQDWNPGGAGPNVIHRADSRTMRERARDLVINNPLARGAVDSYIANVIECGIAPKPLFDDENERRQWVDAWNNWAGKYEPEADITGQQHLYELTALWLEEIIVGGGCLTHYVTLPRNANRRLPLAIELLPEERFADEKDDFILFRNRKKSSNPIRRGIETDSATGRAVAYWVKPAIPNDLEASFEEPISLPADQCRYSFFKRRIGQTRGNTLLHACIMWLWKLGYFTDNELMSSAIKSCYSAVITTDDDGLGTPLEDDLASFTDVNGNQLEKLQPGIVARLRKGENITGVGPNSPGGDSTPWLMLIERSIAVGAGLSYEELTRDYSQGNFSSTRASANADRKRFRMMQRFAINNFCSPTYKRFVMSATNAGLDGFPSRQELVSDMDEYLKVGWRPPGWMSVTPLDDAQADDIRLKNGTTTRDKIYGEAGEDWEDGFEQIDREEQKADSYHLSFSHATQQADIIESQAAKEAKKTPEKKK